MAGATISPSLPTMEQAFAGTPHVQLLTRLVLTTPAVFIAVCAPLAGVIADRWGRKSMLLTGVAVYGVAGGAGLVADSLYVILASRAVLGVAVAGIMTAATTLLGESYEGDRRARVLGWQGAIMSFGGVVFLSAGGALAALSWRGPFAIYLAALVLVPLVALRVADPARESAPAAVTGAPADTTGQAQRMPWTTLVLAYSTLLVGQIEFYLVATQLPFYLERNYGVAPTASGLAIALLALSAALAALLYRRVRSHLAPETVATVTFVLVAGGYATIGVAGALGPVLAGLVIGGAGLGLMVPNATHWINATAPAAVRGRALSGVTTAMFLGQFLSPLASQPLVGRLGLSLTFTLGGALALAAAGCLAVVAQRAGRADRQGSTLTARANSG